MTIEKPDPGLSSALEGFSTQVTGVVFSYINRQLSREDTFAALAELFETLIPEAPDSARSDPTSVSNPVDPPGGGRR